jgi:hypothetical protein
VCCALQNWENLITGMMADRFSESESLRRQVGARMKQIGQKISPVTLAAFKSPLGLTLGAVQRQSTAAPGAAQPSVAKPAIVAGPGGRRGTVKIANLGRRPTVKNLIPAVAEAPPMGRGASIRRLFGKPAAAASEETEMPSGSSVPHTRVSADMSAMAAVLDFKESDFDPVKVTTKNRFMNAAMMMRGRANSLSPRDHDTKYAPGAAADDESESSTAFVLLDDSTITGGDPDEQAQPQTPESRFPSRDAAQNSRRGFAPASTPQRRQHSVSVSQAGSAHDGGGGRDSTAHEVRNCGRAAIVARCVLGVWRRGVGV